ncbi:MAG TPA: thioredoxin domain-containing protein [bacterium]|nr:thioredoxin domain-containing protein [bacterium]
MGPSDAGRPRLNALASEKSPYLLQHATNPVDWLPWGGAAFEKARREAKPIFLSIGYSTCHWCHVMAEESFQDPEVAALINENFVPIKVDREERPDIDHIYITVCQMMTGSAGWPLTIIMTPEARPFFAGTYVPRESRFGRMGMLELVPRVRDLWAEHRSQAVGTADQITSLLERQIALRPTPPPEPLDKTILGETYRSLAARYDAKDGGFGGAPKFPTPHNLCFLLRYWLRTGDEQALGMVEYTLEKMRMGGIYDHLGFGFHRYSTDEGWHVPHFEKMLYDQALLAMAYTEAFQATGRIDFRKTAEEVLAYVLGDLASPEGGFYSAEDADTEGEEGKFYLWTAQEVRRVLPDDQAQLVQHVFDIADDGASVLHLARPLETLAADLGLGASQLRERLEGARKVLLAARLERARPHKDDKILTDWNGLAIASLAKAAQAFDQLRYAQAARRAADFVLRNLRSPDGRLLHRWRDGEPGIAATLDDYAFMVWGLIELYEATLEFSYLAAALELDRVMIDHFGDSAGGLYFTADDGETLLVRMKETYDGAVPSGNSVSMLNWVRLARLTGDHQFEDRTATMASWISREMREAPLAHGFLAMALDFAIGPSYEVVIVGDPTAADTRAMLKALRATFLPSKVLLFRPSEPSPEIASLAPFTRDLTGLAGRATAYVCRDFACQVPTSDISEMLGYLAPGH